MSIDEWVNCKRSWKTPKGFDCIETGPTAYPCTADVIGNESNAMKQINLWSINYKYSIINFHALTRANLSIQGNFNRKIDINPISFHWWVRMLIKDLNAITWMRSLRCNDLFASSNNPLIMISKSAQHKSHKKLFHWCDNVFSVSKWMEKQHSQRTWFIVMAVRVWVSVFVCESLSVRKREFVELNAVDGRYWSNLTKSWFSENSH